jgi:hypothetical protein
MSDDYDALREQFILTEEFNQLLEIKDFEERRRKAKMAWRKFITR